MSRSFWPLLAIAVFAPVLLGAVVVFVITSVTLRVVVVLLGIALLWVTWLALRALALVIEDGRVRTGGRQYQVSEIARLSISRGPQQPFRGRTPSAFRVVLQTRSGAVLDVGPWRLRPSPPNGSATR